MKQHNWLYNYRLRSGMKQSFGGLVRRAAYLTESDTAFRLFEEHYETIAACYQSFFPEVKQFVFDQLQQLPSGNNMNKL
jgi:acyl carrier protein phosphodiesterase